VEWDPPTIQVVGWAVLGLALLAAGVWDGIRAVRLALEYGLGAEVLVHPRWFSLAPGVGRFPVHVLFMMPLALIGGGSFLLLSVWRYVQSGWEE
jgi:hypothetical protein